MNIEKIFKQYDIRGIVGQEITIENTFFIGQAFASFIGDNKRVIIGHDGRNSSEQLNKSLIAGLVASGAEVLDIGLCPTPMLYFATQFYKIKNAIMITASHNPKEYNGFKFIAEEKPLFGDELKKLIDIPIKVKKGEYQLVNIKSEYINKLLGYSKFLSDLKIVWDISNGSGGVVARDFISKLPNCNYIINDDIDGNFPNHLSDSSDINNYKQLIDEVKKHSADYGFFLDGDADRLGVVDGQGKILDSDKIFFIFAKHYLEKSNDKRLIIDVKFSEFVVKELERIGAEVIMSASGHSIIKDIMLRSNIGLAGELSGHFFFKENACFDDGFFSAIKLLVILSTSDKMNIIDCFSRVFQFQKNILLPSDISNKHTIAYLQTVLSELEYNSTDGIRVVGTDGWWLLRASNTENVLTLRIEAISQDKLEEIKFLVASYLIKVGIRVII